MAVHRDSVRAIVADHGSVLIRGLRLSDETVVAAVYHTLADVTMPEIEALSPRQEYSERVYSSMTWPQHQQMCMHHELSYVLEPPGLMLFSCLEAPTSGGATTVADSSAVLDALPAELRERFERKGWMLTRNYNDEVGASLAEAFGTEDRSRVESYCRANAIEFEWRGDALRTKQVRSAVLDHPSTGHRSWFNQIAFLNGWTLAPEVREFLLEEYGELPFDTCFGDGEPIGEDVVLEINEAYEQNTAREPWQKGDLLIVDNVRTAHGRESYEGPREVVVAMADPVRTVGRTPAGRGADG
jgi:alpha-ketoglutarate-dependent taurine dioxygenase